MIWSRTVLEEKKMWKKQVQFSHVVRVYLLPNEDRVNYEFQNEIYIKLRFQARIAQCDDVIRKILKPIKAE